MIFSFNPHVLPIIAAACVMLALLRIAWSNRNDPAARWFAATLLAMLVWAVGYMLEIMSLTEGGMLFWANVQFLGVGSVWICWWQAVRCYVGAKPLPRLLTLAVWFIPVATVILAFLNPSHLFRGSPFVETGAAPFPVLNADYGPWYWFAFIPEVALINGATLYLLVHAALHSRPYQRRHYLLLLGALVLPLAASFVYVAGLGPWKHYNLTVAVTGISAILLAIGLFRWRLFNIVPLAHDLVVNQLGDGVIIADAGGRLADLNVAATSILGIERNGNIGRPVSEVLAGYQTLVAALESGEEFSKTSRGEMALTRDNKTRYFSVTSSPVIKRQRETLGRTVLLHDVTVRVRLMEQIRELAETDDLTGLLNRRHFFELAEKELERARRYGTPACLALLDLDHFKLVNDTFGHQMGDTVLREVAACCRFALRRPDVVGRIGGEEFAVLLPETDLDEARLVCERLCESVASLNVTPQILGRPMSVTVSVGVVAFADYTESEADLDVIVAQADKALYKAKARGRNTVVALPGAACVLS